MGHTGEFVVRARAAECFVIDRLARRALHEVRAAEPMNDVPSTMMMMSDNAGR